MMSRAHPRPRRRGLALAVCCGLALPTWAEGAGTEAQPASATSRGPVVAPTAGASAPQQGAGAAPLTRVSLHIVAEVNGRPFRCGELYRHVGLSGSRWQPVDLRLYVMEARLLFRGPAGCSQEVPITLAADGQWQQGDVALLDFEDRSGLCQNGTVATRDVVVGDVPAAASKAACGVRFVVGVPLAKNHADASTAAAPLDQAGLFWGWAGGYKFFTLEGRVDDRAGHSMHLGSEGCELGPRGRVVGCSAPNRATVTVQPYAPGTHDIVLDVGHLLATSDLARTADGHHNGCMGEADNPACTSMYQAFDVGAAPGPVIGSAKRPKPVFFSRPRAASAAAKR